MNENERDPLSRAVDAPASSTESVGAAPRDGSDEQVGTAPGGDETVGRAPASGRRNTPALVGAVVAVLALLALIIGVFVR